MPHRIGQSAPEGGEWPTPVYDGSLIEDDGTLWRMRGSALGDKAARKMLRRTDVRVVHAYGLNVVEVHGATKEQLLADVWEFLRGRRRSTQTSNWASSAMPTTASCSSFRRAADVPHPVDVDAHRRTGVEGREPDQSPMRDV